MIEIFLIVACVVYVLHYSLAWIGLRRSRRLRRRVPEVYPMISVVVAARNEEANIERCIGMLLAQDYPADRMQIVAVNDDSDDRTLSIIERLARDHPGRITIVCTTHEQTHARGKARAIAQGMDHATGEIILLTDADCAPPRPWARAVVEYFGPGVDVYGGFTIIEAHDYFSAAQQLDWIHLQTLGSCALALGYPVGVIGNNFAFRRSAYDAVGGYRKVMFSVTEDFALFLAMCRNGSGALFPCDRDIRMFTRPCATLAEVLRQKQRWARGGTENTIPGYLVFVVALLMLIAFSIAPFVSVAAWCAVWSLKFACDLLVVYPNMLRLGLRGQLRYFLLFEFYFVAQSLVTPILLMNKTVVWKGRAYRS